MFQVCVLGSGSSGNCTLVATRRICVLVDLGFGLRSLQSRLRLARLGPPRIDAILVTHGHTDHVSGVAQFVTPRRIPVFLNAGTRNEVPELQSLQWCELFDSDTPFDIGDLRVEPFRVSHDAAEPVGFRLSSQGITGGLVTDLGELDETVAQQLRGCDWIMVESNYDEEMLKIGPYPWVLKQRLLSNVGHLSNRALSDFLAQRFDGRAAHIFLAHLSQQNNDPRIALAAASQALSSRSHRRAWNLHLTHQGKPSIVLNL